MKKVLFVDESMIVLAIDQLVKMPGIYVNCPRDEELNVIMQDGEAAIRFGRWIAVQHEKVIFIK